MRRRRRGGGGKKLQVSAQRQSVIWGNTALLRFVHQHQSALMEVHHLEHSGSKWHKKKNPTTLWKDGAA